MPNEDVKPDEDFEYRVLELLCRRTGQKVPPEEHEACLYCFGRACDVQTGIHERFCGYEPGKDPVHFGFPPGTSRDLEG
jgi:hypothetical protein